MTTSDTHDSETSPDKLARDFLELWQEQLRLMADDPTAARTMAETMALWQRIGMMNPFMASGMPNGVPGGMPGGAMQGGAVPGGTVPFVNPFNMMSGVMGAAQDSEEGSHARPQSAANKRTDTDGTATAPSASDDSARLLRELDRRLNRIEERFDTLESRIGGTSNKAPAKSGSGRKRASAKKSGAKKSGAKKSAPRKSTAKRSPPKRKS